MFVAVADTHAVIWYAFADPRLSVTARQTIQGAFARGDDIGLATISLVEMIYLIEKGKIAANTLQQITRIIQDPAVGLRLINLDEGVTQALATIPRAQVPDMPDRIISATAVRLGVPLISRDGKIQLSQVQTIW
jgi:PIN domain nuclease of toxin-antitoxin system